jgi:hypothetical protein
MKPQAKAVKWRDLPAGSRRLDGRTPPLLPSKRLDDRDEGRLGSCREDQGREDQGREDQGGIA